MRDFIVLKLSILLVFILSSFIRLVVDCDLFFNTLNLKRHRIRKRTRVRDG